MSANFVHWARLALEDRPFDFDVDPIRKKYRSECLLSNELRRENSVGPLGGDVSVEQVANICGCDIRAKLADLNAKKNCVEPSFFYTCGAVLPVTPEGDSDDSEGITCEPV